MKSPIVAIIAFLAIITTCWLRFFGLDTKIYWVDEAQSSLRMTGYTEADMISNLTAQQVFHPPAVLNYQKLNPSRGWQDTIRSCASEDPLQPPLYYLLIRFWSETFGSSVVALRILSALGSLLAILGIYCLARELFDDSSVVFLAVTLAAVSPVQMLYAQEVRPYSLFLSAVAFASFFLLRALRLKKPGLWIAYCLTAIAGVYLQPLFLAVLVAHAVFVLYASKKSVGRYGGKQFALACALVLAAFLPWIYVMVEGYSLIHTKTEWLAHAIDPARLLEFEIRNFASNVVDLNQPFSLVRLLLGMAALALIACSVYRLIARGPRRAAILLTLLIVVPALPIMLLDFTAGGIRSIIARYFLPCNLAFVLALAFTLGNGLQSINRQERRRWAYLSIFAIAAGLCSCAQIAATPVWWNKAVNRNTLALASCVNSLQNPLVITNYSPEDVDLAPLITLSYFLNPNSSLELRRDDSAPEMASGYSDYILFMPTKKFRTAISHAWRATVIPIGPTGELWQIIQKNGAAPRIGTFPHLQPPPGGMYGGDPRAIPRVVPFPSGDGSNRLPGGIQHGVPNGAPRSPAPPGMTPDSVPLSPQNEI